jgi:hypothetical protein
MEMILLKYQLQLNPFNQKDMLDIPLSAEKDEFKIRKMLEERGDIVDLNMDKYPLQILVTYNSTESATTLLNLSLHVIRNNWFSGYRR